MKLDVVSALCKGNVTHISTYQPKGTLLMLLSFAVSYHKLKPRGIIFKNYLYQSCRNSAKNKSSKINNPEI